MKTITLSAPNGVSFPPVPRGSTPIDVLHGADPVPAMNVIGALVDGKDWPLDKPINADAQLEFLTTESEAQPIAR